MLRPARISGFLGWIFHRLFASYWMLAVLAVIAAFPWHFAVLWLDRAIVSDWLLRHDLVPVATADTAKDFLGIAAGINAAFITLYFSITLIVLSMAAGNLGVRLIDRWVERGLVRVSLAGLSFSLVCSLLAMLSVDAEAALEDTPLLLVIVVTLLQAINVAMLSVSLHSLARTMFVDTSIDRLANDADNRSLDLKGGQPADEDYQHQLRAPREGYIEDVDIAKLRALFGDTKHRIVVHGAPGQHVVDGQTLVESDTPFDEKQMARAIPIGPYRSDNQGVVFRIRLLVEIAARALSPAVNDFYTALTCADKLATIMEGQTATYIPEGEVPVLVEAEWLVLTGQDFRGLFEDPLNAFRQAACAYPSVAIRMIGNYGRIASRRYHNGAPEGMVVLLDRLARELRDHACQSAGFDRDREDIRAAYDAAFGEELQQIARDEP
ncbi:DUF2254 family protein [Qipengyuania sp. XHP0207]|uniref:DUF2254 family protein n=1 Tax=Qipengyuania sp. XHP0207 TaxID=3038078 RepID=UPI00241C44F4|nr:DUF2254 family protein [Qipengyuania sp. XHP0207]MDG5749212.1 DUF2254 family protein [Qipengyuania sp. XHP0207]